MRWSTEHNPDVVLMDLRMPPNGRHRSDPPASATATPATHVVVLTTFSDDESITDALAAGALGYLTKDAGREDIRRALEPPPEARHSSTPPCTPASVQLAQTTPTAPRGPARSPTASPSGRAEVLAHIARGLSNQEIAATLYLSEATVKTHINSIFAKTHSRDRAQAITYAHEHDLR